MAIRWDTIAARNIDGISAFVGNLVNHPGTMNPQHLYRVTKTQCGYSIEHPAPIAPGLVRRSIRIPGEITNSFCTLYEVGYFVNALFLSGVASALPQDTYAGEESQDQLISRIQRDILALGTHEIETHMRTPRIPIVSWLTDDVEPYRFRKEMLWGISEEASKSIIGTIVSSDMDCNRSNELHGLLWSDTDRDIADTAIKSTRNLSEAKMVQYYLAVEKFLALVGIAIDRIPFFFFSSPYHEILDLGCDHAFVQFLADIHSSPSLRTFSSITRQASPVLIKTSCPACGETSKKVLQGRIKGGDRRTVHLKCSTGEKTFRNEHNMGTIERRGCGHAWEFRIPPTGRELYTFLQQTPFSIHIALANLLQLYTDAAISPVAHVICDLNLRMNATGGIEVFTPYPRGYGSSAELFTSVMGIQLAFLRGLLGEPGGGRKHIVDRPFMILAHQSPTSLFDPRDVYEDIRRKTGIVVGPQDSSIWHVLDGGLSPEEVLSKSIALTYYAPVQMLKDVRALDVKEPALFRQLCSTDELCSPGIE